MSIFVWIAAVALIVLLMLYFIFKRKHSAAKKSSKASAAETTAATEVEKENPEENGNVEEKKQENIPQFEPGFADTTDDIIKDKTTDMDKLGKEIMSKMDSISEKAEAIDKEIDKEVNSVLTDAKDAGENMKEEIKDAINRLEDDVEKFDKELEGELTEVKENADKFAAAAAEEVNKKGEESVNFVEKARDVFEEGKKAQSEVVNNLVKSVTDPKETLFIELTANEKNAKEIRNEFVSIDIEATGIDANSNEITGIAAVKYINGTKTDAFFTNVKTNDSQEESSDPDIRKALNMLFDFSQNEGKALPIVTHYTRYALNSLKKKSEENNIGVKATYFDIYKLSKSINPDFEDHKLNTLSSHYGLVGHESNDAVSDAAAVGEIFLKMTE